MFCRNCGKRIPVDSRFCQYCGTKIIRLDQNAEKEDELVLPETKFIDGTDEDLASAFGEENLSFVDYTAKYIKESFEILILREKTDSDIDSETFILYVANCIKTLLDTEIITAKTCVDIVNSIFNNDTYSVATINILIGHPNLYTDFFTALEKCTNGEYGKYRLGFISPVFRELESFQYYTEPEYCAFKESEKEFIERHEFDIDVDKLLEEQEEFERNRYEQMVRDNPELLINDLVDYEAIEQNYYNDGGGNFNIDDMEPDYFEADSYDYD